MSPGLPPHVDRTNNWTDRTVYVTKYGLTLGILKFAGGELCYFGSGKDELCYFKVKTAVLAAYQEAVRLREAGFDPETPTLGVAE